jgi:hypothetical protein
MAREQVLRACSRSAEAYLLGGAAGLLESLAAGLAELEVEVAGAPVAGFLLWRFVGFLESVAAGAEVELLAVAGAEVAGAGVFCAAIRLTAASRVKIMGFIWCLLLVSVVNLITLREPSCAGIRGTAIACVGDHDHPCGARCGERIFMKNRSG